MAVNLGDLNSLLQRNDELIRQQNDQIRQHEERIRRLQHQEEMQLQHQEEMARGQEALREEALREEVHQNNVGGRRHILGDQDDNDRNRIVNLEVEDRLGEEVEDGLFSKKWIIIIAFVVCSMLFIQFIQSSYSLSLELGFNAMQKMHRMAMASVEAMSRYLSVPASEDEDVPDSLSDL